MKGIKSIFTFLFFLRDMYGEFSIVGAGCETKTDLTFILLFYFKKLIMPTIGAISNVQRYKIK